MVSLFNVIFGERLKKKFDSSEVIFCNTNFPVCVPNFVAQTFQFVYQTLCTKERQPYKKSDKHNQKYIHETYCFKHQKYNETQPTSIIIKRRHTYDDGQEQAVLLSHNLLGCAVWTKNNRGRFG